MIKHTTNWQRARGAMLIPYHSGRMTTYVLLGILGALFLQPLRSMVWFHLASQIFLVIAAILFLLSALHRELKLPFLANANTLFFERLFGRLVNKLSPNPTGWRGYMLGFSLGFLPCGLIYTVLAAAVAKGDIVLAGVGMSLFTIGTIPALILVGMGGQFVLNRHQSVVRILATSIMIFNSLVLLAMAGGLF
jgi:sulfite exporter TauE/SafE